MARPIRYCGDYQNRNLKFARQMLRDGIPFGGPDKADRIIGWGCAFGLVGFATLIALGVL